MPSKDKTLSTIYATVANLAIYAIVANPAVYATVANLAIYVIIANPAVYATVANLAIYVIIVNLTVYAIVTKLAICTTVANFALPHPIAVFAMTSTFNVIQQSTNAKRQVRDTLSKRNGMWNGASSSSGETNTVELRLPDKIAYLESKHESA